MTDVAAVVDFPISCPMLSRGLPVLYCVSWWRPFDGRRYIIISLAAFGCFNWLYLLFTFGVTSKSVVTFSPVFPTSCLTVFRVLCSIILTFFWRRPDTRRWFVTAVHSVPTLPLATFAPRSRREFRRCFVSVVSYDIPRVICSKDVRLLRRRNVYRRGCFRGFFFVSCTSYRRSEFNLLSSSHFVDTLF
jgi:hypothetical protein